jgi:hypothetical protein
MALHAAAGLASRLYSREPLLIEMSERGIFESMPPPPGSQEAWRGEGRGRKHLPVWSASILPPGNDVAGGQALAGLDPGPFYVQIDSARLGSRRGP